MASSSQRGLRQELAERTSFGIVLHPRAVTHGSLRVWLGLLDIDSLDQEYPDLQWFIDESSVSESRITVRRPLAHAYGEVGPGQVRGIVSGVFEFADVAGGLEHSIQVKYASRSWVECSEILITRMLPPRIDVTETFTICLVSCYSQRTDPNGAIGHRIRGVIAAHRPDLTLLVGDQVYLDSPITTGTVTHRYALLERFQRAYLDNWSHNAAGEPGYAAVLDAAPVAIIPDDHDYWNNYPMPSPTAVATYSSGGYRAWETAARRMFSAFQADHIDPVDPDQPDHPGLRPASCTRILEIGPLSIFMMDNRTHRDRASALSRADLAKFKTWVRSIQRPTVPILVTGPSLFQKPQKKFSLNPGKMRSFDLNLQNYTEDYREIMTGALDLAARGAPLLLLTGDVHYRRIVEGWDRMTWNPIFEVISSPSSLVEFPSAKDLRDVARWLARELPSWQRFRWPEVERLGSDDTIAGAAGNMTFDTRYPEKKRDRKGDHVAVLSMQRTDVGFRVEVTYHFLNKAGDERRDDSSHTFDLRWQLDRRRVSDASLDASTV